MAKVTMVETWNVTVQHEDEPQVRLQPRAVSFDTFEEAAGAVGRALELFPAEKAVVTVEKELVGEREWADGQDDSLEGWPTEEHVRREEPRG